MQNNLNCKRPRKIKIGPPPTFFRFLAGGSSVPLSPEWGLVGELLLRCAWSAKRVDGVSLPSGRTTRVGRRKLVHPGSYGDEHRLRLETEQGRSSSVHSGGTARLSVDQNPLSSSRQQNSQPFFCFFWFPCHLYRSQLTRAGGVFLLLFVCLCSFFNEGSKPDLMRWSADIPEDTQPGAPPCYAAP